MWKALKYGLATSVAFWWAIVASYKFPIKSLAIQLFVAIVMWILVATLFFWFLEKINEPTNRDS